MIVAEGGRGGETERRREIERKRGRTSTEQLGGPDAARAPSIAETVAAGAPFSTARPVGRSRSPFSPGPPTLFGPWLSASDPYFSARCRGLIAQKPGFHETDRNNTRLKEWQSPAWISSSENKMRLVYERGGRDYLYEATFRKCFSVSPHERKITFDDPKRDAWQWWIKIEQSRALRHTGARRDKRGFVIHLDAMFVDDFFSIRELGFAARAE